MELVLGHQLIPVGEDGRFGAAVHPDLSEPGSEQKAHLSRAHRGSGLEDRLSLLHVLASGSYVSAKV